MSEPVVVVHGYHAAYNAITEPDKFVACSRYFVRRWMPALGDNGTRIVLALRSLGYYNRETGERRDGIEIELPELAALIGVHIATLKREFGDKKGQPGVQQNPALHLFIRKEQQYWRDPVTNRLLRTANIYRVMMDDPVHEDDLPRLNELLAESEKGSVASKAQNAPQMPRTKQRPPSKAQNAQNQAQNAPNKAQSESKTTHSASQPAQNAPALIDYSESPSLLLNSSEHAPGAQSDSSLTLFGGETDILETLPPDQWATLEAEARVRVIAANGDPVRRLAKEGKAWTSIKPMMRRILEERKTFTESAQAQEEE